MNYKGKLTVVLFWWRISRYQRGNQNP